MKLSKRQNQSKNVLESLHLRVSDLFGQNKQGVVREDKDKRGEEERVGMIENRRGGEGHGVIEKRRRRTRWIKVVKGSNESETSSESLRLCCLVKRRFTVLSRRAALGSVPVI